MNHVVERNFNSLNRRFKKGQPIEEKDIDPRSAISPTAALAAGLVKVLAKVEQATGQA
jgi:hypothetical protein